MEIAYYQVDAFTSELFHGNPAAVCLLTDRWPDDCLMQNIAAENGLPETAFVLALNDAHHIRWFTPDIEMDLCGHATLAAAFTVCNFVEKCSRVDFVSKSGILRTEIADGLVKIHLPTREPVPADAPQVLLDSVSIKPVAVLKSRDYVFVYGCEADVRNIQIDTAAFNSINLSPGGVCVTAPGDHVDFVSRFFTPQATILEDPVTGSAHCSLVPYWAGVLQKTQMTAKQLSRREGTLFCTHEGETIGIAGNAVLYKKGTIYIR